MRRGSQLAGLAGHADRTLRQQIAAQAQFLGVTPVTNNMREFSRVPGSRIENWADSGRGEIQARLSITISPAAVFEIGM